MFRRSSLGLLVLAIVVACSGGIGPVQVPTPPAVLPGSSGGPSTSVAPGQIDACGVLSDEAIKAASGHGVTSRKKSTLTQVFPSVCDVELDANFASLEVSILASGGKSLYETSFEPFIGQSGGFLDASVGDLGDKAGSAGTDTLMVLKGDLLFELFYLEPGRTDKMAVIRYLAEVLLARLPCLASGCPGLTLPPPVATPAVSPTDQGFTGGHPSPAGEQYRVVNLYANAAGGIDFDVYIWDENGRAQMVTTVGYGQASDFFDPGIGVTDLGDRGPMVSFVKHFSAVQAFGFNLADLNDDVEPGAVKTIVASPGDPALVRTGGLPELRANELRDHDPNGHDITPALSDSGAIYVNTDGLTYTGAAEYFYLSVGSGCLALPDFPTVFRRVGGGHSTEGNDESADGAAVVPAGNWTLTIHPDPGTGTDPHCDDAPVAPGAPLVIANGKRAYLLLYRMPGDAQLRSVVLPFGG